MGAVFGLLLVLLYWILGLAIRGRRDLAARESNPLVPGVRRALRNRPFAILLASYVVGSITGAIPATLLKSGSTPGSGPPSASARAQP